MKRLADFEIIELILSDDKKIPTEFIAVKFGKNTVTIDGKEFEFEFTANDADNIIAEFARRGKELVIDYEHQTTSGQKAPAAGWVKELKKTDQGLVALMNYWTDTAKEHLEKGEYRYMSPVLKGSRSMKNWTILHSIALTNHPALHKYEALVASDESAVEDENINKDKQTMTELIKKLLAAFSTLQLSDDSTDENIVKEIEALITDAKKASDEFLQLHDSKSFDEMTLKIQGMVSGEELTKLQTELTKRDAEKAVSLALSDGKITEAKKDWALNFATKNLVEFNDLMKDAPVIVPAGIVPAQKIETQKQESSTFSFSDAEVNVFKTMGFSDEKIEEMRKEKESEKK